MTNLRQSPISESSGALNETAFSEVAPESARDAELQAARKEIARLQDALAHRQLQIEAMHRVGEAMFQNLDADVMARQTLDIALEVLKAQAGSLQLYDSQNDTLNFRYVVGPAQDTLTNYVVPASQGISGQVLRTGVPDVTKHVREYGGPNPMLRPENEGAEAMITVPLKRPGGDPLGVMQLLKASEDFAQGDLEVLQVFCGQAAAVIETARLVKEARQAEIANLVGDVGHDIKNMLTPIHSGVSTLQFFLDDFFTEFDAIRERNHGRAVQQELDTAAAGVREDYGWMIGNALEACDNVKARASEIADAIKGEIAAPVFEDADLNETVGAVARPLFVLADKTNVHLHLDLDHEMPRVEIDRKRMYNALYNLVNNAIPETPSGGSVTIRTRGPKPGENTVLLEVEDTGNGIPEAVRAKLFTDAAVSTKVGGTGLGTRIVASAVQSHNGTIEVQSEIGKGSTFSIRLPVRHVAGETAPKRGPRLPVRRHNLPALTGALIGREDELQSACDYLRGTQGRLLTLTGPGGMGKTRLSLQVAHDLVNDFADGVWLVSLATVDDEAQAIAALATTLGVREEAGRTLAESLVDYLSSRRLLLVLDNFEQILRAAPRVGQLLERCREVRVLVTSRSPLGLSNEREMALPPLAVPDLEDWESAPAQEVGAWGRFAALVLFVERASEMQPGFALTAQNVRDVAEICARLDGLPLAIELAAAHVNTFAPHEMRARLASRLKLLEAHLPDAPARHQTLRATIDWSYELLDPDEKRLFVRLVAFEGGCTLAAAREVCAPDLGLDIGEGLAKLVCNSLVRQSWKLNGDAWFWTLETIREYGLEKLEASGECEIMLQRHAEYYLRLAESAQQQYVKAPDAGPRLSGVPEAQSAPAIWMSWRKRETANLRAALNWFFDATKKSTPTTQHGVLRLALALRDIWVGGLWNERREALRHALESSPDAPAEMRIRAMLFIGDLACLQADYEDATEIGEKSLALSRQTNNSWGMGRSLGILARAALEQGDFEAATALQEESLALHLEDKNLGSVSWTLYFSGVTAQRSGDKPAARDFFERSLAIFRQMDDKEGSAWALYELGIGIYQRDDPTPARDQLAAALSAFREIGNQSGTAWASSFLGKIASQAGDFSAAHTYLDESLHLARPLGDRTNLASALWNAGDLALAEGNLDLARELFGEVAATLQTTKKSARLRDLLRSFARLAATSSQMKGAARLLGAFDQLGQKSSEGSTWQTFTAVSVREAMGEVAFGAAWEEGRSLTLAQAMEEALRV